MNEYKKIKKSPIKDDSIARRGRGSEFLSTFTQGNFNPIELVNLNDNNSDNGGLMRNEPLFYEQTNQIDNSPIFSALKRKSPTFSRNPNFG